MSVSLAITDNADGTVTATISGSTVGSTNVVQSTPVNGDFGATPTWTTQGTRTGDGTITITISAGYYWWVVLSTSGSTTSPSTPVYRPASTGDDPVHEEIVDAVVAKLILLGLPDIGSKVYGRFVISTPQDFLATTQRPCAVVTRETLTEQMRGGLTSTDDVAYPVAVLFIDANDLGPETPSAKYTQWRQSAMRALRNQPLEVPSGAIVYQCEVQPNMIVDKKREEYKSFVSGFTCLFICRERRGFGM